MRTSICQLMPKETENSIRPVSSAHYSHWYDSFKAGHVQRLRADWSISEVAKVVVHETATKQILGLNFGTFVSLVLGIFLICCVCVVGVIICVFRKEAQQRQLETEAHLGTPHSMVVGQSPYPSKPELSNCSYFSNTN
ncbi:uncharacterized protein TNCV_2919991 [Trichonephila clavipes]|nr:uncharacterized protein TNCV_2919991 [Trichonephila clavipes]